MSTSAAIDDRPLVIVVQCPDADGFLPNGWIDDYPHSDFDGPCIGQCCMPEAYPNPNEWTCYGFRCFAKLHHPGECINCSPPVPQPR